MLAALTASACWPSVRVAPRSRSSSTVRPQRTVSYSVDVMLQLSDRDIVPPFRSRMYDGSDWFPRQLAHSTTDDIRRVAQA